MAMGVSDRPFRCRPCPSHVKFINQRTRHLIAPNMSYFCVRCKMELNFPHCLGDGDFENNRSGHTKSVESLLGLRLQPTGVWEMRRVSFQQLPQDWNNFSDHKSKLTSSISSKSLVSSRIDDYQHWLLKRNFRSGLSWTCWLKRFEPSPTTKSQDFTLHGDENRCFPSFSEEMCRREEMIDWIHKSPRPEIGPESF